MRAWVVVVTIGCCTACGNATGPGGWLHDGALLTFELAQVTTYDCDTTLIEPRDDELCGSEVVEVLVSADTIRVHFIAASYTATSQPNSGSGYFDVGSTYGTSSYSASSAMSATRVWHPGGRGCAPAAQSCSVPTPMFATASRCRAARRVRTTPVQRERGRS